MRKIPRIARFFSGEVNINLTVISKEVPASDGGKRVKNVEQQKECTTCAWFRGVKIQHQRRWLALNVVVGILTLGNLVAFMVCAEIIENGLLCADKIYPQALCEFFGMFQYFA